MGITDALALYTTIVNEDDHNTTLLIRKCTLAHDDAGRDIEHDPYSWSFKNRHYYVDTAHREFDKKVLHLVNNGASLQMNGNHALLHSAAKKNNLWAMQKLIKGDCDIDADEGGFTPLLRAVLNGNACAVAMLLAHGANYRLCDYMGFSVLDRALQMANSAVAEVVVACGVPVDLVNANGRLPLAHALAEKDVACVEWLLAHGANIDITIGRWTALEYAMHVKKDEALAALLRKYGVREGEPARIEEA